MRSAQRWRARWPPVLNEWVGDLSDSLKADLTNAPGPFRKSVREASETLKAEFADAGAEVVDRVQQAARDANVARQMVGS